jgi:hypothetical protein
LTLAHVRTLAKRFRVSADLFLPLKQLKPRVNISTQRRKDARKEEFFRRSAAVTI